MASIVERISTELSAKPWQVDGGGGTCSTAVRPFRSSRAIARRRPARSTTRNCAHLEERLRYLRELEDRRKAILEFGRASRASSTTLCARRSCRPTTRRGSRTSIFPTSPSAAPRRRSRARPGSSRSPKRCSRIPSASPKAQAAAFRERREECRDAARRTRRRARHSRRALRRGRRSDRRLARGSFWSRRAACLDGARRQAGGRREILRLFRFLRAADQAAVASHISRCSAARRRRFSTSLVDDPTADRRTRTPAAYEGSHRAALRRSPIAAGPATAGCSTRCAGPGAPRSSCISRSICACGCGRLAEDEAIRVFAANLRDLLLAAPAGARATMGLDPGFRTGVKVAVVDRHRQDRRDDARSIRTSRSGAGTNAWSIARRAVPRSQGRADRDRQRHGLARDRQARRRSAEEISRS